jgi:hypothetical protein
MYDFSSVLRAELLITVSVSFQTQGLLCNTSKGNAMPVFSAVPYKMWKT